MEPRTAALPSGLLTTFPGPGGFHSLLQAFVILCLHQTLSPWASAAEAQPVLGMQLPGLGGCFGPFPRLPQILPFRQRKGRSAKGMGSWGDKGKSETDAKTGFNSLESLCWAPSTWLYWAHQKADVNRLEYQWLWIYDTVNTNWHLSV